MNPINHYEKTLYVRDFIFKTNPKNILIKSKISKIILHTSLEAMSGSFAERKKILIPFLGLEMISGQKPLKTRSKKFIAGFKIKKNQLLGYKVTLRRSQMFSFFEKFINIVLPKLRDFQGLSSNSLDLHGNMNLGFQNFLFFPEIENHYEIFESLSGLQITFITQGRLGNTFALPSRGRGGFALPPLARHPANQGERLLDIGTSSSGTPSLLILSMYQIPLL
jgi:large subunit ribosomal protein L5